MKQKFSQFIYRLKKQSILDCIRIIVLTLLFACVAAYQVVVWGLISNAIEPIFVNHMRISVILIFIMLFTLPLLFVKSMEHWDAFVPVQIAIQTTIYIVLSIVYGENRWGIYFLTGAARIFAEEHLVLLILADVVSLVFNVFAILFVQWIPIFIREKIRNKLHSRVKERIIGYSSLLCVVAVLLLVFSRPIHTLRLNGILQEPEEIVCVETDDRYPNITNEEWMALLQTLDADPYLLSQEEFWDKGYGYVADIYTAKNQHRRIRIFKTTDGSYVHIVYELEDYYADGEEFSRLLKEYNAN